MGIVVLALLVVMQVCLIAFLIELRSFRKQQAKSWAEIDAAGGKLSEALRAQQAHLEEWAQFIRDSAPAAR